MKKKEYVIIRSHGAGVFAGILQSKKDRIVVLDNCRRLWYWKGAASLSQLAVDGVANPAECKFTVRTDNHEIMDVLEVIPVSAKARKSIAGVSQWRV